MAGVKGNRGGGDRVLESRHLVGMFLGVVFLCGVFFTLGYVMGRTQYPNPVHAAESSVRNAPRLIDPGPSPRVKREESPAPAAPSDGWDFYPKKKDAEPSPPPAAVPAAPVSTATPFGSSSGYSKKLGPSNSQPFTGTKTVAAKPPSRFQPPTMLKGSITLQIAAMTRQADALAMADALQQKKFPSFVVTPTTDNFYRVQVGPYSDMAAAETAKRQLDREGFKAIIKR